MTSKISNPYNILFIPNKFKIINKYHNEGKQIFDFNTKKNQNYAHIKTKINIFFKRFLHNHSVFFMFEKKSFIRLAQFSLHMPKTKRTG